MSFSLHYFHPLLAWSLVFCGFGIAIILAIMAFRAMRRDRDPMWYAFGAFTCFVAVCLAAIFGDMNFWYNMQPYYDMEYLNTYPSVDPSQERGDRLMDAGQVYFAEGSALDLKKAMGFKNHDVYCVTPVVRGYAQPASYDFWAVGINCCSAMVADFGCGEYNNIHARSGLRMIRDDQRPFFHLAVQQAEAAYNIKAEHPLFFYWMQDPAWEMDSYRNQGYGRYLHGVLTHFGFNLSLVLCAAVAFAKMARS